MTVQLAGLIAACLSLAAVVIAVIALVHLSRALTWCTKWALWEHQRAELLERPALAASLVTMMGNHSDRRIATMMPHQQLMDMYNLLLDEEDERKKAYQPLRAALDDLRHFDLENPRPAPPPRFSLKFWRWRR